MHRKRGFTLIEVLAALIIVGLGMLGVIQAVIQAANNGTYLREKTLAHWIAMNLVTERRRLGLQATLGHEIHRDPVRQRLVAQIRTVARALADSQDRRGHRDGHDDERHEHFDQREAVLAARRCYSARLSGVRHRGHSRRSCLQPCR
jgi:prepilin-type N-terminal cleavage/methylation domain-containing protein